MRSHLLMRMTAATAMLAGAAGGVIATAPSAAAIQFCNGFKTEEYAYSVNPAPNPGGSPYIYVEDNEVCSSNPLLDAPLGVSISKYLPNGTWQVVASGSGSVTYSCTGGRYLYTTSVTTKEGKPAFYCG